MPDASSKSFVAFCKGYYTYLRLCDLLCSHLANFIDQIIYAVSAIVT